MSMRAKKPPHNYNEYIYFNTLTQPIRLTK